jgi:hypothetical protein
MVPVQRELTLENLIRTESVKMGRRSTEVRVVPLSTPKLRYLGDEDRSYLDESIRHYWDTLAIEVSDESHGPAWRTLHNRQRFFYEAALLTDSQPRDEQMARLESMGRFGNCKPLNAGNNL